MTDKDYNDEVKAVQEGKMWPDHQGNLLGNIIGENSANALGQSVTGGFGSGLSNSDEGYADKISQYKDYVSYKDFTIDDSAINFIQYCEYCQNTGWLAGTKMLNIPPMGKLEKTHYPCSCPEGTKNIGKSYPGDNASKDWAEYKAKIDADKAKLDEQYKEQLLKNKISELEAKKNKKSLAKMLGLVNDKEIEAAIKKLTEELAEYTKKSLSWPGGIITDYKGSQLDAEQQALGVYYDKGFIKNLKANTPISSLSGSLSGYAPKPYEAPQPEPAKIEVRVEEEPQGRKFKEPL